MYVNHSFYTRPGPRPGFRVLTGSPESILFLKKSKRHHLVKNKTKVNGLQPGF